MTNPRQKSRLDTTPRSAARMSAVQALYQMDIAGTPLDEVIDEFVTGRIPREENGQAPRGGEPTFFADLLRGVVRRQTDIDPLIDETLATGWRLVRVDSILRAILRAGVFELLERPDVPARVVINEYINAAHAFFAEDEPKVVNGILDRLAHRLRAGEFEPKAPGAADG